MPSEIRGSDNFDSDSVGKVLQVVVAQTTATKTRSTSSWSTIYGEAPLTITPVSATSKIIIQAQCMFGASATPTYYVDHFRIWNTTSGAIAHTTTGYGGRNQVTITARAPGHDTNDPVHVAINAVVDSGSTTARTYDLQHRNEGGATRDFGKNSVDSSVYGWAAPFMFTAIEIEV